MTSLTCADPRIGEQLLDLAQFARRRALVRPAQLSSEQARHIEGCASCRASLERTRRLVATHQSLEPSDADVAAARVRFAERRLRRWSRAPRARLLSRTVTVALLLALVGAAAAQIAIRRPWQGWRQEASQTATKSVMRARAGMHRPSVPALQPLIEILPPSAPTFSPPVPRAANDHRVRGPVRNSAAETPETRASTAAESAAPVGGRAAGSWEAVAAALRAGDQAAAETALNRLAALDDARTRDAARLARAQLWLAHGRPAPAHDELEDLAATGATTTIRARAREALLARP